MAKKLPPVHPGEILREEFLLPLKLTPYAVAAALHVPRTRIERIAREEKPVSADTALRLGKFFKTGTAFWMRIGTALCWTFWKSAHAETSMRTEA
jgi:antitoxin HigA-1